MKLGRDVAGLRLQKSRIRLPGLQELADAVRGNLEPVDENDRTTTFLLHLLAKGNILVHLDEFDHAVHPFQISDAANGAPITTLARTGGRGAVRSEPSSPVPAIGDRPVEMPA